MTIETDIVTLPAYWASALVNGDTSGMDDDEIADMEAQLDGLASEGWRVVSTVDDDEPRFTWSFNLYGGNCAGGDVLDYVVHKITD
jgi:hypothetical protein